MEKKTQKMSKDESAPNYLKVTVQDSNEFIDIENSISMSSEDVGEDEVHNDIDYNTSCNSSSFVHNQSAEDEHESEEDDTSFIKKCIS